MVWLTARPETILARMSGDATTAARRPNLTDKDPLEEIVQLLAGREPIYQESAHLVVDTEGKTPAELAEEIMKRLGCPSLRKWGLARGTTMRIGRHYCHGASPLTTADVAVDCRHSHVMSPTRGSIAHEPDPLHPDGSSPGCWCSCWGHASAARSNLAIYRLAWYPRPISPWSRPDPSAPPRRVWDRLPIFGWLGLRREATLHGTGFWIRPMLLELLAGHRPRLAVLVGDRGRRACCRRMSCPPLPLDVAGHDPAPAVRRPRVLIALMLAASMIDVDEKIIPDEITIPGTLLGC